MSSEVIEKIDQADIEILEPQALSAIEKANIDMQIATARKYPRMIKTFISQAMSMATLDEDTASSCFYVIPRAGKNIQGPGIRLAEIVAGAYGNLRYGARIVGEDDERRSIIGEAFCHDLQSNTYCAIQVKRRITDKQGRRYSDDMITVTGNAACSIALRNVIFKVVPMAYVNQIYEAAKKVAIGDAKSLADRRSKMLDHFAKLGIQKDRVIAKVAKSSVEDVDLADLETLVGIATSIKDGDLDIDVAFPKQTINDTSQKTLPEKVKQAAEMAKGQ